jgi:hypothetical protein
MRVFLSILILVASLMAASMSASASAYVYTFSMDGAGADPPNNNPGVAFGTLTLTEPNVITLDITYSLLSSDMTKVNCAFGPSLGNGVNVEFYPANLPPSGHWTTSLTFPTSYMSEILQYINLGEGDLQLGTVNYPFAGFGEIGGAVTVPEPSSVALVLLAVFLGFSLSNFTKNPKGTRRLTPRWSQRPLPFSFRLSYEI